MDQSTTRRLTDRLSADFHKGDAARYERFQRGQRHEERGNYLMALQAYERAGAHASAASMRQQLAPVRPTPIPLTVQVPDDVVGGRIARWAHRS